MIMKFQQHNAAIAIALLLVFPYIRAADPPFSCDESNPSTKNLSFCNRGLPIKQRAKDLVGLMSLDEKISQLVNTAPGIPRLGIAPYQWWSEALHGVAVTGPGISLFGDIRAATSFPQVILTAASFDARLWYRIGQVIGREARAIYNVGQAKGMTFWAPNINIFRDPRWSRGQETPGEDPFMTGRYAMLYVRGLQGDSFEGGQTPQHLQASACCKHFTAYDLDRWNGVTRYRFNALVTAQDMADTYQPPFESCIQQGRASGIMCAYNRVNGVPACADYNLLTTTAREKWGFDGYITSDCGAVSLIKDSHGFANTHEDAVADVLKAGMDLECGTYLINYTKSAVQEGKVIEEEIDRALENLFAVRIKLGLFDGNPRYLQYGNLGPENVCTQESRDLALEAAQQGIVLLKNDNKLLPLVRNDDEPPVPLLTKESLTLAVIGPNANATTTLLGNYRGIPCSSISPLQALQSYVKDIRYHAGCENVACSSASILEAMPIAVEADYVVLVMGLDTTIENEGNDRLSLMLPGEQQSLITEVARVARNPVILVLLSGGPIDITFAKEDSNIGSIIWAGYPGEAGAIALAQIIFGDNNPGGKLPMTWYPEEFMQVPMTDMRMRADPSSGYPGRTYKFYNGKTVYDFGFGLSYTSYSYQFISVSSNDIYYNSIGPIKGPEDSYSARYAEVSDMGSESCSTTKFSANVRVCNEGEMEGKHPVLMYVRKRSANNGYPKKKLVGFESVKLRPGEITEIQFELSPCEHLSRANNDGLMVVEEGTYFLIVGDQEFPITLQLITY